VNNAHIDALRDLVDQLEGGDSEEDKKEHEKYALVLQKLATFQEQVADWVENKTEPAPKAGENAKAGDGNKAGEEKPSAGPGGKKPPPEEEEEPPKKGGM